MSRRTFRFDRFDLFVIVMALLSIPMFLAPLPWPLLVLIVVTQMGYWIIRTMQWNASHSLTKDEVSREF